MNIKIKSIIRIRFRIFNITKTIISKKKDEYIKAGL